MNTPSQFQTIIDKRDRDVGIRDISEPKTLGIYSTVSIVLALLIISQWLVLLAVHDEGGGTKWWHWVKPLTVPFFANVAAFSRAPDFPNGWWMAIYLLNPLFIVAQDKRFPMKIWAVAGAVSVIAGAMFAPGMSAPYAVVQAVMVWFLGQVMATQVIRLLHTFKIVTNDRVVAGFLLFGSLILLGVGVADVQQYVTPLVAGILIGIWMWFYKPAQKV